MSNSNIFIIEILQIISWMILSSFLPKWVSQHPLELTLECTLHSIMLHFLGITQASLTSKYCTKPLLNVVYMHVNNLKHMYYFYILFSSGRTTPFNDYNNTKFMFWFLNVAIKLFYAMYQHHILQTHTRINRNNWINLLEYSVIVNIRKQYRKTHPHPMAGGRTPIT